MLRTTLFDNKFWRKCGLDSTRGTIVDKALEDKIDSEPREIRNDNKKL